MPCIFISFQSNKLPAKLHVLIAEVARITLHDHEAGLVINRIVKAKGYERQQPAAQSVDTEYRNLGVFIQIVSPREKENIQSD